MNKFKEIAEKQRKKIQDLKRTGGLPEETADIEEPEPQKEEAVREAPSAVSKLTEENLRKSDQIERESQKEKKKKKASSKPAWALTEKDVEE